MNSWTPFLEDPHLIQALGYTVLHSLWQGCLLALIFSFWIKRSKSSSNSKYNFGLYSLLTMLVMSMITFMFYFVSKETQADVIVNQTLGSNSSNVTNAVAYVLENPGTLLDYMPLISNIWLFGMLIYSLRIVLAAAFTMLLRKTSTPILNTKILNSVKRLSSEMRVTQNVRIATSLIAKSPMMIGHFKPVILMPLAIINALTIEDVDAIICHELAHIKRSDYLINLLQTVVEVLYYYHPAIYYISEQIRAEREHCCDDIAIRYTKSSLDYAKVLVRLQDIQISSQRSLAMHFKHSNQIFMNRIKRLLSVPSKPNSEKNRIVIMIVLVLLLVGVQQSAHSISRSISDRLLEPIDYVEQLGTSMIVPIHNRTIKLDTTPKIKTIVKKKTITIIDGDSTITETVTESDGNDSGFHFGDDNVVRWFSDGEKDFTLWIDSLRDKGNLFNNNQGIGIKSDSMFYDNGKMKFFFNDEDNSFAIDSMLNGLSFEMEDMIGNLDVQVFHLDSLINGFDSVFLNGEMMFLDEGNLSNFRFEGLDELRNLENLDKIKGLKHFDFRLREDSDGNTNWLRGKSGITPADKINRALNRDGLLEINKNNKVELSGKNLKVNGDKQPQNIHSKYKRMWEDATGVSMSKDDKVTLELIGKENKREIQRF